MDDDLKLVERLQGHAIGSVNELEDDLIDAIRTITRLHAENADLRDKLDSVGLSEAELERCCKDLDLQIAQRDAERDEHMAARSELFTRALKAEAQRDAAYETLVWIGEFSAMRGTDPENVFRKVARNALAEIARKARAASRTLGGVGG